MSVDRFIGFIGTWKEVTFGGNKLTVKKKPTLAMSPRPNITDTSFNNVQNSLTIGDIETETNDYGKTETVKDNKIISRDDPSDFSNMVIQDSLEPHFPICQLSKAFKCKKGN